MPDITLGSAFVDVTLRPKNIEKDADQITKRAGKKIESFFDKYSKESFLDKYARRSEESKLEVFLPSDSALKAAVLKKASVAQASMKSSSRAGMVGAQLSYGLQDFLTGISMGNFTQGLLGMSNNLSMIAMQFGAMGGMITSVALSALPLIYTGMKALISNEKEAKEAVDALTAAFERQKFAMKLNAIARQALTDEEVHRMRNADQIQGRIEEEKKSIKNLDATINDHRKSVQAAESVIGGRSPGSFMVKAADDQDVARHAKLVEDFAKQQAKFPGAKLLAAEGEIQRSVEALAKKYGVTIGGKSGQFQALSTREGVEFTKATTPEERQTAIKQKTEASAAMTEANKQKTTAEADTARLTERRNELLRRDLGYMQRYANSGFNEYEQAKIALEQKHIQQRQELRDRGFGNVPLGKRMTEADKGARIDASNKAEQEELDANIKAMNERHEKNMQHGRHLSKKEQKEFADNETEIKDRHAKDRDQIVKEFEQGPGTLLDPAMKALKTQQGRERALLAEQFANKGPAGHFASMEGLAKEVQQGIGGSKGIDIAQKTADNTKGTQEAVRDLITAVKDLNLGIGP